MSAARKAPDPLLLPHRPARTAEATNAAWWAYKAEREVFSKHALATPGLHREIALRRDGEDGPTIAIGVYSEKGEHGGLRIIPRSQARALREALALLRDPTFRGRRFTGRFALRSGARMGFSALRSTPLDARLEIRLYEPDGAQLGKAIVISGGELAALGRAVAAMDGAT